MDVAQPSARLIEDVMVDAKVDLTTNASVRFSKSQVDAILTEAKRRLLQSAPFETREQARTAWNLIVRDFHTQKYWGHTQESNEKLEAEKQKPKKLVMIGRSFLIRLFIAMVITKTALLFAGSYYSTYPGDGYGYWLIAAVVYTVFSMVYIVWKYRDIDL